jgi:hypothetical protein
MTILSRRVALKLLGLGAACLGRRPASAAVRSQRAVEQPVERWSNTHDRVWLGESVWANPMEDWRIVDGAAQCQSTGGNRNIQLITHQLERADLAFAMSVRIGQVERTGPDAGAGFRIGVRSDLDEYRSNCFAGDGLDTGLIGGRLVLDGQTSSTDREVDVQDFTLRLAGAPDGARYSLTLTVESPDGQVIDSLTRAVESSRVLGNVALVNGYRAGTQRRPNQQGTTYRFSNWTAGGDAFVVRHARAFGPILWSMYTLSDSGGADGFVLSMSALTGPLGERDNSDVELHVRQDGGWIVLGSARLDPDAWVASFRHPNWDARRDTPYRLVYRQRGRDGAVVTGEWTGTIKANPVGRPLRLAALTCQNDYGFPYEPVARNLIRLDPDLLYFSGDQIYEGHGGYGIIREPAQPAILNYLRKFYQFGWSFRDAMKDRPTLCIPDDHDVFQGNLWGEGGARMRVLNQGASAHGGYREPARMVRAVHRTCAGHHPDLHDPTPVEQDISVYYGEMVYGGVGFAVIADRQWKSGPERVDTGDGRADHVPEPDFDTSTLDQPGLVLLGERQEAFLEQWADDWHGHTMKVLLSQTVFAGVATHHGRHDGYLKADLDSGGWPQTARNRAIEIVRRSMALHVCGDQHLATLSQYGVDRQRDSNWAFCTPAISAGYQRWWRPDEIGMTHERRPAHGLPDTGEFVDGLGNKVYVYAVGNPMVPTADNRYDVAHQKGSGFGFVTIDTEQKTYRLDAFRFSVDALDGDPANQFPGWPVTVQQKENAGNNEIG